MMVRRSYENRRQNIDETENRLSVKTKETEPNKNWKRLPEKLIDLKYVFCRATIRFFLHCYTLHKHLFLRRKITFYLIIQKHNWIAWLLKNYFFTFLSTTLLGFLFNINQNMFFDLPIIKISRQIKNVKFTNLQIKTLTKLISSSD